MESENFRLDSAHKFLLESTQILADSAVLLLKYIYNNTDINK